MQNCTHSTSQIERNNIFLRRMSPLLDGFTFEREELGFQVFDVLTTSGRRHPVHVGADLGQGNTVTEEADLSPHLLHLSPQAGVVKRLVVVPFFK